RITALASANFPASTEPDVIRAYREAIATLSNLGAMIDEDAIPLDFEDMMVQNGLIIAAEAYALHRAYIDDARLDIDPWVRRRVQSGKGISAADLTDVLATRQGAIGSFAQWMQGRSALVPPTLPITALPVSDVDEATTPLA